MAPDPTEEEIGPGTVLSSRYRLDELLGEGGMGRVYRGFHLELKTPVAIKVMHDALIGDRELSRRFEREARAAMMLSHPNVVRVLDLGREGEKKFIVMELIHGVSLGDIIQLAAPGRVPLSSVVDLLAQTADALAAAHEKGLVHRDLKPDNVIVSQTPGGAVARVLDFGLVKMTDPEVGGTLTKADQVAGTPAYMSPEQCRSLSVGPAADLYSLGCMLHEMLSGQAPFTGASPIETIARQLYLPVPPVDRGGAVEVVPADLEALRRELLAKVPEERPRDAVEVAARLRSALHAQGAAPLPSPIARGSRPPRGEAFLQATMPALSADGVAICVFRAVGAGVANLDAERLVALGAQGITTNMADSLGDLASRGASVGVIDGGHDVDATIAAVRGAVASRCQVPVLALASVVSNEQLSQLIEAGAADVVRGAVDPEVLAKKVRRLAKKRR